MLLAHARVVDISPITFLEQDRYDNGWPIMPPAPWLGNGGRPGRRKCVELRDGLSARARVQQWLPAHHEQHLQNPLPAPAC